MTTDKNKLLIEAAELGDLPEVRRLVAAGADWNWEDMNGKTALAVAEFVGESDVVAFFKEKEAEQQKMIAGKTRFSLLAKAATDRNLATAIHRLIVAGANAPVDEDGTTPLIAAVTGGDIACVKMLLDAGAVVNAVDFWDETALHYAADCGRGEIAKILIDAGADVNAEESKQGLTPLQMAENEKHAEIVKMLIDAGAVADGVDADEDLSVAALNGDFATVKKLIEGGADINAAGEIGRTPLHWAAREGHIEIVEMLLVAKADVNTKDALGETPFLLATQKGHYEIAKKLKAMGATPEGAIEPKGEKHGKSGKGIPMRCPRKGCNDEVIYWEGQNGEKVFFIPRSQGGGLHAEVCKGLSSEERDRILGKHRRWRRY